MRVAFVVHHYDPAEGTGGYVTRLLPRIAEAHEVTLYAATVRVPVPDAVRVVRVPAVRGRAYATILSFPYAFAAVRGAHDVVHAQGWVANRADVVTTHIVLAAWRAAVRRTGGRVATGERLFGSFVERRERRLVRQARAVIAPSDATAADIARFYGRSGDVWTVPHGFPSIPHPRADVTRAAFDLPPAALIALYAGDARKGLAAALCAVASAERAHLLIASHSAREPYRSLEHHLGVCERVHWLGPRADMDGLYALADVLLHPTIYDTFGLVVAEAMAHGVPPIVSPHAGVTELLQHGVSAWIADGPDATAEALRTLAADRERRLAMGRAARETARTHTWDAVAERVLAIYDAAARR